MAEGPRNPRSGGILLALGILAGAVGGTFAGEPSMGFLAGVAVGTTLLVLVWLLDRRRA